MMAVEAMEERPGTVDGCTATMAQASGLRQDC